MKGLSGISSNSLFGRKLLVVAVLIVLLVFLPAALTGPTAGNLSPLNASAAEAKALWQAYQARYQADLAKFSNDALTNLFKPILDQAFISADGQTGVLWLALEDHTGRVLATEPGVVFAQRQNESWKIVFSNDSEWTEIKESLPEHFLPASFQSPPEGHAKRTISTPLTGYYLPYVAGTAHRLEGSILHFHNYPPLGYPSCSEADCHYAYDFTDAGHFPLVASKAGTVISSRDSCFDGNPSCTNYIILQDVVGGTYQIYLHLAYNTIPNSHTPGTFVNRGKYLGDTDDTGYSTSEHVHFMVTNGFWYGGDGYPWGYSIDVRFADVLINAGIPRTCYEVKYLPIYDGATNCNGDKENPLSPHNDWFVSGNLGASLPSGQLTRPVAGAVVGTVRNPLMDVTAETSDDVRVVMAVLQAFINGKWLELSPRVSKPTPSGVFDWDVNLCQAGIVNGPLEVALKIWDHEGNLVSLLSRRTIQVAGACSNKNYLPFIISN